MLASMKRQTPPLFYAAGLALFLFLGGCSMDVESKVAHDKKIELHRENFSQTLPAGQFDEQALFALGDHYHHHGEGPVDVLVTYDPKSRTNTAMAAAGEAARISALLRKNGVVDVKTDIMPVNGQGESAQATVDYGIISARPPSDCKTMGGLDGVETGGYSDYTPGCAIQTQIARQIARPKDLLGREGLDKADGRRQANVVETYKTGERNEALQIDETSSE